MKTDQELIYESYIDQKQYGYHVTYEENLESIREHGLLLKTPDDMDDIFGVYMFQSMEDVDNALTNWLGERLDEDKHLKILKVDITGLKQSSDVDYEVIILEPIDYYRVVDVIDEDDII
jgi:hypothetical protein